MRAPYRLVRSVLALALLAGAAVVSAGCVAEEKPTLVVLGPWTGGEEDPFEKMLKEMGRQKGRNYVYEGTRSLRETLVAQLRTESPPDVAILNGPGELAQYARDGDAQPLPPKVAGRAIEPWAPRITVPDKHGNMEQRAYWAPVRVDLKSIVWSRPGEKNAAAEDARWCLGMASGATSGWPGTDWIEDLLLQREGPDVYERWATGALGWTDKRVKRAWQDWAAVLATDVESAEEAITIPFESLGGGRSGLLNRGDCTREHQGAFVRRHYGLDVMPAPTSDFVEGLPADQNVFEVSGDMAAVFKPSDAAWELVLELTSSDAQDEWGEAAKAGEQPFFPTGTGGTKGATPASEEVRRMLNGAERICLDASDAMPSTLRGAFQRAVLEFLENPLDEAVLDGLLGQLEAERLLQKGAGAFVLDDLCDVPPGTSSAG
ncbi:extracellular solute-binding protein [Streptomyces sp. NPDC058155]|uniref:extracellular solute-binding protein n=1 Tax=Streptomyces sp. NPDC058155 TaxID=3346359 RepID=UPI0036E06D4C